LENLGFILLFYNVAIFKRHITLQCCNSKQYFNIIRFKLYRVETELKYIIVELGSERDEIHQSTSSTPCHRIHSTGGQTLPTSQERCGNCFTESKIFVEYYQNYRYRFINPCLNESWEFTFDYFREKYFWSFAKCFAINTKLQKFFEKHFNFVTFFGDKCHF
jgi:hypothetical protein